MTTDDVDAMSEGEARAEVRRLRRVVARLTEPTYGPFRQGKDGAITADIDGPTGTMVISALVDMLGDAKNYVAVSGWHPVAGSIEAIVQRVGKLSPHEARVQAEGHLARAVAMLAEHGIVWDGPTTFLPELPQRHTDLDADPSGEHPWLRLDIDADPNVLCCQRCGARQEMPRRGTAAVMMAVVEAFSTAHADCQDGDGAL